MPPPGKAEIGDTRYSMQSARRMPPRSAALLLNRRRSEPLGQGTRRALFIPRKSCFALGEKGAFLMALRAFRRRGTRLWRCASFPEGVPLCRPLQRACGRLCAQKRREHAGVVLPVCSHRCKHFAGLHPSYSLSRLRQKLTVSGSNVFQPRKDTPSAPTRSIQKLNKPVIFLHNLLISLPSVIVKIRGTVNPLCPCFRPPSRPQAKTGVQRG